MNPEFSRTLSLLRQEKGVSQRKAADALGISQALLSHYENGIREPGLAFVVRACDYYGVSADFLLGRTLTRDGTTIAPEELYDLSDEKDNSMRVSVLALLSKKLLVNSVGMLFDLLGKTGSREAIRAASNYLSTAVYKVFRRLYQANPSNNPDFFSVPARQFAAGLPEADMACSEVELCDSKELFKRPLHPYTKGLLSAIPIPSIHVQREEIIMSGEVTSPINPKPGCRFASRCPYAKDKCREALPQVEEVLPGHFCACHYVREINQL